MIKITRISTTLTARYAPVGGATDAYWLDSRMPGAREVRAADVTLDREDDGFFFSVFAAPQISKDAVYDIEAIKPYLDKMHMDIKHSAKNIDNLIVDFAECSTNVVGKKTISTDGVKNPFFAGVVVKNAEIAAVTTGRGCAYLYRNDALYPLTQDDLGFKAIDHFGREVPNYDIYSAGSVGNVRYSNIANLQVDDCFIVCNKEIISALGQKELLRIFDEAYDQSDAAGMVITAAASKLPGTPLQFMMGFIESINEGGRQPSRARVAVPAPRFGRKADREECTEDRVVVDDMSSQDYVDYEDDDEDEYYEDDSLTKKIALTMVIVVVTAACAFAIWWTIFRDRAIVPATSSEISSDIISLVESVESEIESEESTDVSVESNAPTVAPTKAPTSAPSNEVIATHTIQPGELLSAIATKYYGSSSTQKMQAIVDANKTKYPTFTVDVYNQGWVIDIPKLD